MNLNSHKLLRILLHLKNGDSPSQLVKTFLYVYELWVKTHLYRQVKVIHQGD